MLIIISFDLINRVKYQLFHSQKWQYHLCGDELCARRQHANVQKLSGLIEHFCRDNISSIWNQYSKIRKYVFVHLFICRFLLNWSCGQDHLSNGFFVSFCMQLSTFFRCNYVTFLIVLAIHIQTFLVHNAFGRIDPRITMKM